MRTNLRTAAYCVISVLVLVLGASASQAHLARRAHVQRPRLVAEPSRLAAARDLAPGDRVERLVELRIRGTGRFAAVYLRVRARSRSALDIDSRHGLRIAIDRCSTKWRGRRGRYSCRGRRFVVVASRPLVGHRRARLRRLGLRPGRAAHLRLTLTFPAGAGNELEAQLTRAVYSFVGVTRAR
jgi:spore coat-associated protein N